VQHGVLVSIPHSAPSGNFIQSAQAAGTPATVGVHHAN
jgi:hypothetical protein